MKIYEYIRVIMGIQHHFYFVSLVTFLLLLIVITKEYLHLPSNLRCTSIISLKAFQSLVLRNISFIVFEIPWRLEAMKLVLLERLLWKNFFQFLSQGLNSTFTYKNKVNILFYLYLKSVSLFHTYFDKCFSQKVERLMNELCNKNETQHRKKRKAKS